MATEAAGMPLAAMLQSFAALGVVLAVIAGAAWLLKRAQRVHATTNPLLKTVAALALGPKERVVLVEVDDTWLVLGVAPGQVNVLHSLPRQALPATSASVPRFAEWLAKAKAKGSGDAAR